MTELQLNDLALAVNIRNMTNALTTLHGIVALQTDNIPHLLARLQQLLC
jgi:hypothetical protein